MMHQQSFNAISFWKLPEGLRVEEEIRVRAAEVVRQEILSANTWNKINNYSEIEYLHF